MSKTIIGKIPDFEQRCSFCAAPEPAPYMLSIEYVRELKGNPLQECVHLECLERRQLELNRFPFLRVTLDHSKEYEEGPYASDNQLVMEDIPAARYFADDNAGVGIPFCWEGKQYFIEPERSKWIDQFTIFPRNLLVALKGSKWWLCMPKNQAIMFRMKWGGDVLEV